MKKLLLSVVGVFSLMLGGVANAQYATAQGAASVNVPSGKILEVINFLGSNGTLNYQLVGGTKIAILYTPNNTTPPPPGSQFVQLAGPGVVTVTNPGVATAILNYKLYDQPSVTSPGTPSSSVVIPTNATGQVNIILESSTDLLTWTPAEPGSYGAATQNRFFRVRAAAQ